jgi:hypothetical protein
LTVADATPASAGCTPSVAVLIAVENTNPRPMPSTSSAGRISVT